MYIPRYKTLKTLIDVLGLNNSLDLGHEALLRRLQELNRQRFNERQVLNYDLYTLVDYDKSYPGLQLVLGDKAIHFDDIPYSVVPMIYDNKLFGMDFTRPFPKVISQFQDVSGLDVSAVQIGSAVLPIAIDSDTLMKDKDNYVANVFDLLWLLMSGRAGTTEDQMLSYVKDNIVFTDNEKWINFYRHKKRFLNKDKDLDEYDYTKLKDWYTSQFFSDVRLAEYNPDLTIARYDISERSDRYKITIYIHDMYNNSKELILPSDKIIPDNVLIPNYSAEDLHFFLNLKDKDIAYNVYKDIAYNVYKEVMKNDRQR